MCGITGFAGLQDKQLLKKMNKTLLHRGPDGQGYFLDNNIGLANRRLSIVDIPGGKQPMHNEDKSIWVVFNGEIYNYKELMNTLETARHRFYSHCDTEVLVHSYEEFGEKMFDCLNGQFAFALWDSNKKRLLLARDFFGKKPLYYTLKNNALLFASEIKAILEFEEIEARVNEKAVAPVIALGYVPGKETMFEGIFKLNPGEMLIWQKGKIGTKKFFEPKINEKDFSEEFAKKKLLELLRESVRIRVPEEVRFGFFVSGGIDSSTVAALAKEFLKEEQRTYAVGFPEGESELEYAKILAEHLQSSHTEVMVDSKKAWELLTLATWHFDEPLADAACIPTFAVAQEARKKCKVAMAGEAGDELFAGYDRYKAMLLAEKISKIVPNEIQKACKTAMPLFAKIPKIRVGVKILSEAGNLEKQYFETISCISHKAIENITGKTQEEFFEKEIREKTFLENGNSLLNRLLLYDLQTQLAESFLMKADKNTMASSLEERIPFLDKRIVNFAFSLKPELKIRWFNEKYVLKKTMSGLLPKEIVKRKKQGYNAPFARWLKTHFSDEVEQLTETNFAAAHLKKPALEKIIEKHKKYGSLSYAAWRLVSIARWHELFIEGRGKNIINRFNFQ